MSRRPGDWPRPAPIVLALASTRLTACSLSVSAEDYLAGPGDAGPASAAAGYVYVTGGISQAESDGGVVQTESNRVYYARVWADGSIGYWQEANSAMGFPLNSHSTFVQGQYLYAIGTNLSTFTGVQYAPLEHAVPGGWTIAPPVGLELPVYPAVAHVGADLYLIGGGYCQGTQSVDATDRVFHAALGTSGAEGWKALDAALPKARCGGAAVALGQRVYLFGGTYQDGSAADAVLIGQIDAATHEVTWIEQDAGPLNLVIKPAPHCLIVRGATLYIVANLNGAVFAAEPVDDLGRLSAARQVFAGFGEYREGMACASFGDTLYLVGGWSSRPIDTVTSAKFGPDGTVGDWTSLVPLEQALVNPACVGY